MNWPTRRTVPVLLGAAIFLPVAAVSWLAWSVLRQDAAIDVQRRVETLRGSAARLALALEGELAAIEGNLNETHSLRLEADGPVPAEKGVLLFRPDAEGSSPVPPETFAAAEVLEFQKGDKRGAAAAYEHLARSADPRVRAGALVRLGALRRQEGNRRATLSVYDQLQRLGSIDVDGQPAELIARQARSRMYQASNERAELQRESAQLAEALYSGRLPIDRATFSFYSGLLSDWGVPLLPASHVDRTEAALTIWQEWRGGALPSRGRRLVRGSGAPVLAIWAPAPAGTLVRLINSSDLVQIVSPLVTGDRLGVSLWDPEEGSLLAGHEGRDAIALLPGETRLPFVVRVGYGADWQDDGQSVRRRWLFGSGIALTLLLMLAAIYGLARATSKEMSLVQQQADFVSTVSHEFRTPLTSMRHLTDLLTSNSIRDEARKATYYELLARQTQRLEHLVEGLLNYNRMQAGAYAWQLEVTRVQELVRNVIDECRQHSRAAGRTIDYACDADLPAIALDRDALSRAVSNLIDNSAKYSEPNTPIHVAVKRLAAEIEISVADRGVGIPPEERRHLFERFVRGTHAKRAGIEGIGIGLALVRSVAIAHGGKVRLDSEVGRGSTFTISLPIAIPESPEVPVLTPDAADSHR